MNDNSLKQNGTPTKLLALADHLGHPDGKIHGGTTYFVNHFPAIAEITELSVCFLSPWHPAAARLEKKGVIPIFLNRSKWDPLALWDVFQLIRKKKIGLLHLHSEKSLIIGGFLSFFMGVPSILHIHDAIALKQPLRTLQRWAVKRISAAILITDELREHAINEYGFSPERVNVLNYGMDLSPLQNVSKTAREELRGELNLSPDAPAIALVGRVNRDKGQLEMITAMKAISKSQPEAKLLIVGDGPAMDECKEKVAALQLENSVLFLGQRDDIPEILAAVDLVTVPSMWHEGFGFVALEAIAAGRPVVAFRSGGIPNTVIHNKTGLLVKRGDVDGLSTAVSELLGDRSRMEAMSVEGIKHAEKFSIKRHIERLANIYNSVLSSSKSS